MRHASLILFLLCSAAAAGPPEMPPSGPIDTEMSRMTVEVGTAGLFTSTWCGRRSAKEGSAPNRRALT
jgi:hypothetical protein